MACRSYSLASSSTPSGTPLRDCGAKPSHSPDGRRTGRFTANGWIIKEGKRKERKAKEIPFMAEGREAVTRENLSGMALEGAESPRSGFHPLFLLFLSENTLRRIFWAGWAGLYPPPPGVQVKSVSLFFLH